VCDDDPFKLFSAKNFLTFVRLKTKKKQREKREEQTLAVEAGFG
jgi:hypothetical protein